jgi:hypothetical protein
VRGSTHLDAGGQQLPFGQMQKAEGGKEPTCRCYTYLADPCQLNRPTCLLVLHASSLLLLSVKIAEVSLLTAASAAVTGAIIGDANCSTYGWVSKPLAAVLSKCDPAASLA